MNISTNKLISGLAFGVALSTTAISAQSPVGTWKGGFQVSVAASATAAEKQQFQQIKAAIGNAKVTLVVNKDHTYTFSAAGSKGAQNDTGTWSLSKDQMSLTSSKHPNPAASPKFTLSKNGHKMSVKLPIPGAIQGSLVLTR